MISTSRRSPKKLSKAKNLKIARNKSKKVIYLPVSCRILTRGHIQLFKKLSQKGRLFIGVLTDKAMENYKNPIVPFKDRLYILKSLNISMNIVPQSTLNPLKNLKKYRCTHIVSGDGWEKEEIDATDKLGVVRLNINSGYSIHASDILLGNEYNSSQG